MKPAIFLDRDGVIIENQANYVRSWADVSIFPQALKALASLSKLPYSIVIVTNQSAIGRGIISQEQAEKINSRLINEITKAGGRIDAVYMCPHAPQTECSCRKPKPGLLLQAAKHLSLDLQHSLIIGDALSDLKAGQLAGLKSSILVLTGRGFAQAQLKEAQTLLPFSTYNSLFDAYTDLFQ
ncbi:MAG: D-glycero-beta-D-manno-heptose-1,7-bisphosphate 7-phosphatase [Chloroflexi bacterium]|nr:MAG: D-glycero-beta-D-manno-heptose-1,7-bisphosphate 7-phosphatase [Chloroflexota bacterium]